MPAPPSRLVLFDIDGTLVTTGGRAGAAIVQALEEVFGIAIPVDGYRFAGKTDPMILIELLERAGVPRAAASGRLAEVFERYLRHLPERLTPEVVRVLPGVRETLEELEVRPDVHVGLLTGNLARGAEVKLRAAGLWGRFGVGAFGSDHAERDRLVAVARARARARFGAEFPGHATVVVGDAPADVRCARAGDARAVAVASGHIGAAELATLNPDALLASLAQPGAVAAILGEGAAADVPGGR